jgi:predicted nucleotidyltransferase
MFDTHRLDEALRSRRLKLEEEREALLKRVQEVLRRIRRQHGIEAAYIVGSLKTPGAWRSSSDVDVAVRGCSHALLEVMKALEEATDRQVDVIDLDRHPATESFTEGGLQVYG